MRPGRDDGSVSGAASAVGSDVEGKAKANEKTRDPDLARKLGRKKRTETK